MAKEILNSNLTRANKQPIQNYNKSKKKQFFKNIFKFYYYNDYMYRQSVLEKMMCLLKLERRYQVCSIITWNKWHFILILIIIIKLLYFF